MIVAWTKLLMEFQDLCTFETFQQFWSHYGYEGKLEDVIEQEFSRTKGEKTFDYIFKKINTLNTLKSFHKFVFISFEYNAYQEKRFGICLWIEPSGSP